MFQKSEQGPSRADSWVTSRDFNYPASWSQAPDVAPAPKSAPSIFQAGSYSRPAPRAFSQPPRHVSHLSPFSSTPYASSPYSKGGRVASPLSTSTWRPQSAKPPQRLPTSSSQNFYASFPTRQPQRAHTPRRAPAWAPQDLQSPATESHRRLPFSAPAPFKHAPAQRPHPDASMRPTAVETSKQAWFRQSPWFSPATAPQGFRRGGVRPLYTPIVVRAPLPPSASTVPRFPQPPLHPPQEQRVDPPVASSKARVSGRNKIREPNERQLQASTISRAAYIRDPVPLKPVQEDARSLEFTYPIQGGGGVAQMQTFQRIYEDAPQQTLEPGGSLVHENQILHRGLMLMLEEVCKLRTSGVSSQSP